LEIKNLHASSTPARSKTACLNDGAVESASESELRCIFDDCLCNAMPSAGPPILAKGIPVKVIGVLGNVSVINMVVPGKVAIECVSTTVGMTPISTYVVPPSPPTPPAENDTVDSGIIVSPEIEMP
jgi:hypothetical protein